MLAKMLWLKHYSKKRKKKHLSASVWASVGRSSRANEAKQPARLDKGLVLISVSGDSIPDVFCETKKTGTGTNLSPVQLPYHSLLISDEEPTRASELMSTEYVQNMYLVSNNWMNSWSCKPRLLWRFAWSREGFYHRLSEWTLWSFQSAYKL